MNNPTTVEEEMSIPLRELIDRHCGCEFCATCIDLSQGIEGLVVILHVRSMHPLYCWVLPTTFSIFDGSFSAEVFVVAGTTCKASSPAARPCL